MSVHSPRVDPGCQYFRQTRDPQPPYMEINLLLSSINRGLLIQYEVSNSRTVTCQITSSIVTVQKETTNQSLQLL